jgi:CubicO group peptidase (beta-lactamase class C family)
MKLDRRSWLAYSGGMLVSLPWVARRRGGGPDDLRHEIERLLAETGGPGISCAIVGPGKVLWSGGFGLADRETRRPMRTDTLLNVASVSKTVTATAVMQLWEVGRFRLQDDVGRFLPFPLRNPHHPDVPITFEQLLTHRASIKDGPGYFATYACGDPTLSLDRWLRAYLTPGGEYWDAEANWHEWAPGTAHPPAEATAYSNVGYGVLGYLVEILAGRPFPDYCRERIFQPLGMSASGWFLRDIDVARHATPYTRVPASMTPEERLLLRALAPPGARSDSLVPGALVPRCLYSFANYPDGSLRTSADELARFLATYLAKGRFGPTRLLREATVDTIFSREHLGQRLCWHDWKLPDGRALIGHSGGDPGVTTYVGFEPTFQVGVVSLRNWELGGERAARLTTLLLDAGLAMR